MDGEDLASLLRRIGRLPQDKALEIARQLCAGLAAAHDKGVVHRDLKPGNIMLDGKGQLRITDFGLAGVAGEVKDIRSGTPAYMAPEQRSGREVTARSDIYALGVVLHEVFTGRSFSADSSHPDLAPEVDRVIRRCLAEDPAKRPASALAVSAALPGGDALAAALAAGETPPPEMVAAAGDTDSVSVRAIGICAALILAGLIAAVILGSKTNLLTKTPFPKSPAVLEQRAQDVIQSLGYTEPPVGRAYGFLYATDYQSYAEKLEKPPTYRAQLAKGQPPLMYFWYRQSPQYLEAAPIDDLIDIVISVVSPSNPPPTHVGMINLSLDAQGRLIEFRAIPPQVEETPIPQRPADWTALLTAAGLDMTRFSPAEPQWIPSVSFDARAAWTGSYGHAPEVPLRIEAASWRSRPVYFQVIGPWSIPERMQPPQGTAAKALGDALFICTLILAVFLAWRNIRLGRGDNRGALRLAAFVLSTSMLVWLCSATHVPTNHEFESFVEALNVFFASAGRAWIFYMAMEPYVRRRWPQIMIAWSRLPGGGVRDPLVGGHVLIGAAFGLGLTIHGLVFRLLREQSRSVDHVGTEFSFSAGCPAHDPCPHWGSTGSGFYVIASPLASFPVPRDVSAVVARSGRCNAPHHFCDCSNESSFVVIRRAKCGAFRIHPDPIRSIGADGRVLGCGRSASLPAHRGPHHLVGGQLSFRDRQCTRADRVRIVHRLGRATLIQGRIPRERLTVRVRPTGRPCYCYR